MKEELELVWIVKYALTQGIWQTLGCRRPDGSFMMNRDREGNHWFQSVRPAEWSDTLEGALAKAEELRKKKIKSLEKQLAKVKVKEIKVLDESDTDHSQ